MEQWSFDYVTNQSLLEISKENYVPALKLPNNFISLLLELLNAIIGVALLF